MLPSITRLSQEYDVAKGTAVKALNVLRREGLTRTVAGWGTFVAERG
jgi:DNA-binding GntR family transcriptional regulator